MRSCLVVCALTVLVGVSACAVGRTGSVDPFPERPYALDVTQVDPCAALTENQQTALALKLGRSGTSQGGTSRGCNWVSSAGLGWNLQTLVDDASTAVGAEPTSTIVEVGGFGAVQSSPPARGTGLAFCQVVLDVADGASLRAQVQVTPLAPDAEQHTVERTCEQVRAVAELMIDNLHARQTP
ncbi:Protein of unknown function [Pseudonocardia ammonioxydans]|uniref:DUF3558 domain-containing protein n=1 Tax=Pseudonocardia ammonioxydans TaxID=260086 RepID=A0A1I4UHF4_PSUAM|nr:DUF3558 family protein [Pseudonocardia ammonioxydans]SFM88355.1 Protein of unknown function [Pseudonocardia ammonioxydans]